MVWKKVLHLRTLSMKIFLGTLLGSSIFFFITNLGVFIFQTMYPKNPAGLVECFVMALPFFRNTLAGDLFYTAVFFVVFAFLKSWSKTVVSRQNLFQ